MSWIDAPERVLVFARGRSFACLVNLSDAAVDLPAHERVLLTSVPLEDGRLPVDGAAWLHTV